MWTKVGKIFTPRKSDWIFDHAYVPTSLIVGDFVRIYVSFWDKNKIGRIGYVDIDPVAESPIIQVSKKPVLDIGQPGTFDDNGVTPSSVLCVQDEIYLYYIGWQLGVNVRYYLFMGLATSLDRGETFHRFSRVPILERNEDELFVRTGGTTLYKDGKFLMWYVGGSKWILINGKAVPFYNMKRVESSNGRDWFGKAVTCLEPKEDEIGFGRPSIMHEDNKYKMWYSIRKITNKYVIGYAESDDGITWERFDEYGGLLPSPSGWDSSMTCFGSVFDFKGKRYMVYNGNNFGEEGFGMALWE